MTGNMLVMSTRKLPTKNTNTKKAKHTPLRIAALSVDVVNSDLIQLLPSGSFRSNDGSNRPDDAVAWVLNQEIAENLINQFNTRAQPLVIDYEHQTLNTESNGQPAPAAGWINKIVWQEGKGLFAKVDWTSRARQYINDGEYRYISPVFAYDDNGHVLAIAHAALTNNPALTGMDEVRLAAASALAGFASLSTLKPTNDSKEHTMNEVLELLRSVLGLPEDISEADLLAALQGYIEKQKAAEETITQLSAKQEELEKFSGEDKDLEKLSGDDKELEKLSSENEELKKEVAALRAGRIDPTKYVPVAALADLQAKVNKLSTSQIEREVDEVVTAALTAKKLTPALEPWARDLGKKDMAALRAYIGSALPIAALSAKQSTTLNMANGKNATLSEAEMAVCRATGITPEVFVKQRDLTN